MTNEEKQHLRDLKTAAATRLASLLPELDTTYRPILAGTDPRLLTYATDVATHPGRHNLYELLAVERYLHLAEQYPWRAKRVKTFYRFYESLRFNGTSGRRRYRLTPVQCFQFASIFGFSLPDGRRLCRTAYIFVPRKFSKATSAASLAVYDMIFGDNNAQAYVGANSYAQAKICFDEIRHIMQDIDPSGRRFRVNREKITYLQRGRDSSCECLAANAKTKDGLNASLVIMDEYAQARNTAGKNGADLKNVLTSSMGARRDPLTVIITTASEVVDGPFAHELDGVKAILRGERDNDTVFASIFQPDVDDADDDPETWAKVQPHLGITVQPDFYSREYANAQMSAENMLAFRTKLLNVFTVNEQKTWFSYERARDLLAPFQLDTMARGLDTAVAFDLSVHDDFSAVSYTFYHPQHRRFYSHTDYYFPEGALPHHPNRALYEQWHEEGHLHLCQGDRIDVRQIAEDILEHSRHIPIIRIGYDAYKAQELVNILRAMNFAGALQPVSQTYGNFNLPVESFELLAYDSPPRILIADNPINAYCLSNCLLDSDRLENKKPVKISQYRKIDGTITLLMTLRLLYEVER